MAVGLDDDGRDGCAIAFDRRAHSDAVAQQLGQLTDPSAVGGHPRQIVEFVGANPSQSAMIVGMQSAAGLRDAVGAQRRGFAQRDIGTDAWADCHVDAEFLV